MSQKLHGLAVLILACTLRCAGRTVPDTRVHNGQVGRDSSTTPILLTSVPTQDGGSDATDAADAADVAQDRVAEAPSAAPLFGGILLLPWICQRGEIVPGGLAPNAWPPLPSTVFIGNAITVPRSGQLRFTLRNASGARIDLAVMDDRTGRGGNVVGLHLFILRERGDLRTRSYMVGDTPMAYVSPGPFNGLLYTELVSVSRDAGEVAQTLEIAPGHEHWSGPLRFRWARVSRSEAELLVACSSGMRRVMVDMGR